MGEPAKRRATYEDLLLAAPERLVAEIIDGALVTRPRLASKHALAESILGSKLTGPFCGAAVPV